MDNNNNNNSTLLLDAVESLVSWLKTKGGQAKTGEVSLLYDSNVDAAKVIRSMGLKKFTLANPTRVRFVESENKIALADFISAEQVLYDFIKWVESSSSGVVCRMSDIVYFYRDYPESGEYIRRMGAVAFLKSHPEYFQIRQGTQDQFKLTATPFQRMTSWLGSSSKPSSAKVVSNVTSSRPIEEPNAPSPSKPKNKARLNVLSPSKPSSSSTVRSIHQSTSASASKRENNLLDKAHPPAIRPTVLSIGRKRAEMDKDGIRISPKAMEVSSTGFIPKLPVQISVGCDPSSPHVVSGVSLHDVVIFDPRKNAPATQMRLRCDAPSLPLKVIPSTSYNVKVEWSPNCPNGPIQIHVAEVQFMFFSEMNGWFTISRFIALDACGSKVLDPLLVDSLRPESEYFQKKPPPPLEFSTVPNYPRIDDKPSLFSIRISRIHVNRNPDVTILEQKTVTLENYLPRFGTLLHLNAGAEAAVLELSTIRAQKPTVRAGYRNILWFIVDGLGEKRPSVLRFDKANVEIEGVKQTYGGTVQYVEPKHVGIYFAACDFDVLTNRYLNVGFTPDLYSFQMSFHALKTAVYSGLVKRLFDYDHPLPTTCPRHIVDSQMEILQRLDCFEKLNEFQQEAIKTIVTRMPSDRRHPFLLFGPPGTGKTTTLVAAVACLLRVNGNKTRVLVSAPSNVACDVFRDKLQLTLHEMKMNTKVARLMASSKADKNQPEPQDVFEAQVVIATCVTSGRLASIPGYFTHVLVDEAGQCTEPEVLIPLGFSGEYGQIVLGGDHKQLGPVIQDKTATQKGRFDVSLFERLMQLKEYATNNDLCRMLRLNYRSHEQLVKVPSDLFYAGQLIAAASKSRESLIKWKHLPTEGIPLILHHVKGKEDRENHSPSWFNVAECVQVVEYIKKLRNAAVAEEDIAVIAPYQGQVRKLRKLLSQICLTKCRVDTVERFQGDEARVTIVTTCRSSSMNDDYDAMYHVGFLKNEKRMNVAITRAKELLIVVGNLTVLRNDPHWKRLVRFAENKGAIVRS